MACGCNKNKNYAFVHTYPEGSTDPRTGLSTKEYPTEIEARAAVIRSGGDWEKRPK